MVIQKTEINVVQLNFLSTTLIPQSFRVSFKILILGNAYAGSTILLLFWSTSLVR